MANRHHSPEMRIHTTVVLYLIDNGDGNDPRSVVALGHDQLHIFKSSARTNMTMGENVNYKNRSKKNSAASKNTRILH